MRRHSTELAHRAFIGLLEAVYRPLLRRAARQILQGRRIHLEGPEKGRWLRHDVDAYLETVWEQVAELLPEARLERLPTRGNQHNVFLAAVTTAAYRALLDRGVSSQYAATLVADVGWKIYSWMLGAASLPSRLTTRAPQLRMVRTLRALMRFPFSAPGRPGYEVEAWADGDAFYTTWRHCPPEAFVRRLVEEQGDRGELDAFYRSWCLYDWAGADLIAGDGERGHYRRLHTLSRGDAACDMRWRGCPQREGAPQ